MTVSAQHELWNGPAGRAWVEAQDLLDAMFAPFESILTEAAQGARQVLDIGCGTGATTLALARALPGSCAGIDISLPMVRVARERAAREGVNAHFFCADAAAHMFCPESFDLLVSRFGVMFFDDPVAAFANLRRAARADARLCCIAWRSPAENPFMTTAERTAAPLQLDLPPRPAGGPGQFAFADPAHVRRLLEEAGWQEVALVPLDVECSFPEGQLTCYLSLLGPVGIALQRADAATRERVIPALRAAFEPFVDGETVRFTAACWRIEARA